MTALSDAGRRGAGASVENHLLALLPHADRLRLLRICVPVELVLSEILGQPGAAPVDVYFPVEGFVSLVRPVDGHPGVEVGMVGREGMVGAQWCLAMRPSSLQAVVQGAGTALRVGTQAFRTEFERSDALRVTLHRYIHVAMEQLATSAACLRFHLIGPRLARWLLMSQDRAHADTFRMTQEFLAYMLGVRRVGITAAAGALQRDGLIAYQRGVVRVLDRPGLEAAACSCYAADRQSYADALPHG